MGDAKEKLSSENDGGGPMTAFQTPGRGVELWREELWREGVELWILPAWRMTLASGTTNRRIRNRGDSDDCECGMPVEVETLRLE